MTFRIPDSTVFGGSLYLNLVLQHRIIQHRPDATFTCPSGEFLYAEASLDYFIHKGNYFIKKTI
jgi:hypothetical protein